jgi:hypothetical protein
VAGISHAALARGFGVSSAALCFWKSDHRGNVPPDDWAKKLSDILRAHVEQSLKQAADVARLATYLAADGRADRSANGRISQNGT